MTQIPENPQRPRAKRVPRSVRRTQLLAAAHRVFVEHGYHGSSMDQIAEEAEVSKPVVYQHFPSKDELYEALLEQHLGTLWSMMRTALDSTEDNRERIRNAIRAYFTFTETERRAYRLVFESDVLTVPAIAQRLEDFNRRLALAIADCIARDADVSAPEAELLGRAVGGSAQIAARAWAAQPESERLGVEEAVELLANLLWRGISRFPPRAQ
ncbi:TetR/AcrR family transcriptional regulator [Arthrobacter sp. UM1]|uniref:TetR/AcrR family transcriptional regulator n=1 Tax=Arthrobacter sp. UM1 TaxID=2766776 RepID=UPI001CF629C2|nr:TetR/AcrR family transcriptional regulator [Arthrobacter sp. UM1]MCB4207813.1 TetR/AcrR family transcriptional regulator [Arthrobacter sp. UM1]